ncbi:tumor necrosis factor receptor superfamily member 10B-like [Leptodactylus fuscus]
MNTDQKANVVSGAAGTHVSRPCTENHGLSFCEPCTDGEDFTEDSNGLDKCLPCRFCRSDEIQVVPCTRAVNAKCQCKEGTYCEPNYTCDLFCRTCISCGEGQLVKFPCTPTSDTVCEDIPVTNSTTRPSNYVTHHGPLATTVVVLSVLMGVSVVIIVVLVFYFCFYKRMKEKKMQEDAEVWDTSWTPARASTIWHQFCPYLSVPCQRETTIEVSVYTPKGRPKSQLMDNTSDRRNSAESAPRPSNSEDNLSLERYSGVAEETEPLNTENTYQKETLSNVNSAEPACPDSRQGCGIQDEELAAAIPDNACFQVYQCLGETLPLQRWKDLLRLLGLPENDIEIICQNYKDDVYERNYQMLLAWRKQEGRRATLGAICDVLNEMKLAGCIRRVKDALKDKGDL